MGVAALGSESPEGGLDTREGVGVAADHEAVALGEAPDAPRDAGVQKGNTLLLRGRRATLRVAEVRVAAVHDRVAVLEQRQKVLVCVLGGISGGNHQPEHAGLLEPRRELDERVGRAVRGGAGIRLHLVPVPPEALRHVAAHAAEADHAQFHRSSSLTRTIGRPRSFRDA
jgi:hypothetical protein